MKSQRIKKLAEAATPGSWEVYEDQPRMVGVDVERFKAKSTYGDYLTANICTIDGSPMFQTEEDAAFIAALNPAEVLRMVELMEQMAGALKKATELLASYTDSEGSDCTGPYLSYSGQMGVESIEKTMSVYKEWEQS